MARILTVADLQEHIESDLGETALQRLIDDADQAVVDKFGPHGDALNTVTDDIETDEQLYLFPKRQASSIVGVTEYTSPTLTRTLVASDFRLVHGGKALKRLTTGVTPSTVWGWRAEVEYFVSTEQNVRRRRVVIDLVRLEMQYTGIVTERAGDYSVTNVHDYQQERERLMNDLGGVRVF